MSLRISYSGSNTLLGCERKFYYEKVKKVDNDPDYTENSHALRVGKAFHQILEECNHGEQPCTKQIINKAMADNDIDSDTDVGLIIGMVKKYIPLHEKAKLKCIAIETEVGNGTDYIGYIDAVMGDANGNWWIVDLKTAAQLSGSLLSRLCNDPQLNLYSNFVDQLCKEYKSLDPAKFSGVRYRVTTKAKIKRNKKETIVEFIDRVVERVESYDIGIPAKDLNPKGAYKRLMGLLDRARKLDGKEESEITQNFSNCESYFRPCPYWSKCYGATFTAAADKYKIFDSQNIKSLEMAEQTDDLDDLNFDDLEDL